MFEGKDRPDLDTRAKVIAHGIGVWSVRLMQLGMWLYIWYIADHFINKYW